jgi:hypothetical protein
VGVPKNWDDSKKDLSYIRKAGVRQFISTYNRVKDLTGDELLWGDEIEYGVFKLDPDGKKVRLSLRAKQVRALLFSVGPDCSPLLYLDFVSFRGYGIALQKHGVLLSHS